MRADRRGQVPARGEPHYADTRGVDAPHLAAGDNVKPLADIVAGEVAGLGQIPGFQRLERLLVERENLAGR